MNRPYQFDEFFASGRAETISPFLTPGSRPWGENLSLKSALFAAFLLLVAFILKWISTPASHLTLCCVYFLTATPALIEALEDLRNLEVNIDVLMTLAALLSILIGSAMEGALLLVLFAISGAMEEAVMQKTKSALLHLRQMAPKMAFVFDDKGGIYERATGDIPVGSQILVKAGELVPLDGLVIAGSSEVSLAHLTGENTPQPRLVGDEVPAGARNLEGALTLKVTRTSRDSTLTRIIQLVIEAQASKPATEQLLDRFGKYYATTIMLLSGLFAITLPLFFHLPYLGEEGSIYRALTFLIAASPCALIIATPTAYLSSLSSCTRKGLLLKGGAILDAVASCHAIAFDKTGTLTTGKLVCKAVTPLFGKLDAALSIAASLERHTVHPIATAICEQAPPLLPIRSFKSLPGFGLEAEVEIEGRWNLAYIGHSAFIESKLPLHLKAPFKDWELKHHSLETLTLLLVGENLVLFEFEDELRSESLPLIEKLKKRKNFNLFLLTGDHWKNAQKVAAHLGLSAFFANLRPEGKLAKVAELSKEQGLIMVGDGINDAPALARATVGISLGKIGSATAVDASDVVLLRDELLLIDWLITQAKKTVHIVRENLLLALAVIICATTPALLGFVPLWVAVILHEGGTLLVGLNSLRLLK